MQFGLYRAVKNKDAAISAFYGLDRTGTGAAGEMEDMKNMSSAEYPFAAPRGARLKKCGINGNIQAVCAPDSTDTAEITGFTGICDEQFIYNGVVKSGSTRLLARYQWSIIRLGRLYIINGNTGTESIMYQYNPANDKFSIAGTALDSLIVTSGSDSTGSYLATFRYGFNPVRDYTVTDDDGNVIKNEDFFHKYANDRSAIGSENIFSTIFSVGDEVEISGFPTADTNNGQIWYYNTSSEGVVAQTTKDYSSNNTVDADTYSSVDNIDKYAITNAYVKSFKSTSQSVSGQTTYVHYIYFDLTNKNGETVSFDDMQGSIYREYCSGVTISKRKRCFNAVTAHQGRIWGAVVGGRQIYASASDDIFSFSASDIAEGYGARLPSDTEGAFCAFASYGGELYAFKENSITVIGGTGPSNYNSYVINGIGCIDGKSVISTASGIIFLSHKGFCICSGGNPVCISEKLHARYSSAVSGWDGEIYYASALRRDGVRELLTCDVRHGLWHIQDDTAAEGFFSFSGGMYLCDDTGIYEITERDADMSEWSFTTCASTLGTLDNKAVNELWIYADISSGAAMEVYTSVSGGTFSYHGAYYKPGLNLFRIPVRAVSGTDFRIRLCGRGRVVVRELELNLAQGGRRYKEN